MSLCRQKDLQKQTCPKKFRGELKRKKKKTVHMVIYPKVTLRRPLNFPRGWKTFFFIQDVRNPAGDKNQKIDDEKNIT